MYEALLECGHIKEYSIRRAVPTVGKPVVCLRHTEPKAATVLSWCGGWKLSCRDCKFTRQMGTDKNYAIAVARGGHLSIHPNHAVELFVEGSKKEETIEQIKPMCKVEQGTLPF